MSPQSAGGACIACASYIKGACWLHGVKVRGSTSGKKCFKEKANGGTEARMVAVASGALLAVPNGGDK